MVSKNILKIYPKEDTLQRTIELLEKYNLKGQKVFDAQQVATMLPMVCARPVDDKLSDIRREE
ncbi:MAG: hypothetical protein FGF52_04320 [Candidatus Brockarchaeota archaeon]|nr:hypothetical protein [Candidatus Brockarchaeota archaeon]